MSPRRHRSRPSPPSHRPSPLDGPPELGNGAERFDDDGVGLGADDGPESQGRRAGEGYGLAAQGEYGDEDYDPSGEGGATALEQAPERAAAATAKRPDASLRDEILERLDDTDLPDAGDLDVQVRDGVVMLAGGVEDDAVRDAIEACVADVAGVREVENRLVVRTVEG